MHSRASRASTLLAVAFLAACEAAPPNASTEQGQAKTEVLVRGGPFRGANGIYYGPDGLLWVASVATQLIAAVDPETGEIRKRFGPEEGVKGPDDLAFGPDGTLCWTEIQYGEVVCMSPGGETEIVASPGRGVNPITFSDDGRLFVSQCFSDDKLYEIDPKGSKEPRLISDQLGPHCGLNGMDWGSDGRLYGPRWFHHEVVRVDVDTGDYETVAGGFGVPAAVKFDSQDRLHVLDTLKGQVVRVDRTSGAKEVVATIVPGLDNLAFGPDDRLFVSSFVDGFVREVLGPENHRSIVPGGFIAPAGMALVTIEGQETLVLADLYALRKLDPSTGEQRGVVRNVIGFSELGGVLTVAPYGTHLVLTNWRANTVKLWNPVTDKLMADYEDFQKPTNAISMDNDLIVAEGDSGHVIRFSPETPDTRTILASGLQTPTGLASVGGDLYVSEQEGGRILQVLSDGAQVDPPRVIADGLQEPEGLAFEDGNLWIVEAGAGRLLRMNPVDGSKETVADGLGLQFESKGPRPNPWIFNGLAVSGSRIYVSGDRSNVVYLLEN